MNLRHKLHCCLYLISINWAVGTVAAPTAYDMCRGCHSPDYHRTGPQHCGLFGAEAASQKGYQYSDALKGAQLYWDRDTLDQFLRAPLRVVPGTSMTFTGVSDPKQRQELIDYLESLTADHADCR